MAETQPSFNPDELLSDELVIDKLDAARLQLESAITMFFHEWDAVSQHTLIGAAHGIVYDLAKKQGIEGSIKDSPLIRPEKRGEFIKTINLPQNFFKHADKHDGIKLLFRFQVSHFFLFDAIRLFILLFSKPTHKMKVFLMWFQLRYPDLLCFPPAEEDLQKIRQNTNDPEAFKDLAKVLLEDKESSNEA